MLLFTVRRIVRRVHVQNNPLRWFPTFLYIMLHQELVKTLNIKAIESARPSRRSTSETRMKPPSLVVLPPSKPISTRFFRLKTNLSSEIHPAMGRLLLVIGLIGLSKAQ